MQQTFKQDTSNSARRLDRAYIRSGGRNGAPARIFTGLAMICSIALAGAAASPTALADTYQSGATKTHKTSKLKSYMATHPKVRKAAVGAGVGTAAGAAVGLISGKGVLRGAAIGAGTGAAVGAVSGSKTLSTHPVAKNMAAGTITGAGIALAMNRGHGQGKRTLEGAGIGAVAGLGASFLKKEFH